MPSEDRFTNTPQDAARFERDREDFPPDRPDPSEYEDFSAAGCQMCGAAPDDPCDCFDPQVGP